MLSLLLLLLYPLAIQYKTRNWRWLTPLTLFAAVLDVVANYTELALLTGDFPRKGEHTFSQRLARLKSGNRWHRLVARITIPYLNYFDPGHIKP